MKHISSLLLLLALCLNACKSETTAPPDNNNNTGKKKASGRVSLSVRINDSRSHQGSSGLETKTVEASGDLAFNLAQVEGVTSLGTTDYTWDASYGGKTDWFETYKLAYKCNGNDTYDYDTMKRSFSSADAGSQPGGFTLNVNSDGTYVLAGSALYTGAPSKTYSSHAMNCEIPTFTANASEAAGIDFIHYFTPFFGGATGFFTGTMNGNRANGSFNAQDQWTLFSFGTETIKIPVEVTVTWDLTIE